MISIPTALVFGCIAAVLGFALASILLAGPSYHEACGACPINSAWQYVRQGLAAKGYPRVTPELVVALIPAMTRPDQEECAGRQASQLTTRDASLRKPETHCAGGGPARPHRWIPKEHVYARVHVED